MADFIPGLYLNEKHDKAPDFVKGYIGIDVKKFVEWLNQQAKTEKGYLAAKIDLLESREGKLYLKLNDWKPKSYSQQEPTMQEPGGDDIPF